MEVKVNINSSEENHNSSVEPAAPAIPEPTASQPIAPVGNTEFISLAQAAKLTGYHQDYLGQLARGGKLAAQKIGRNWVTTLDAVKKLDPTTTPEIAPKPQTAAITDQTIFEKPSVSLAEHEALKKELEELRKQILERQENQVHDNVYVRKSSFEADARKELLPAAPIQISKATNEPEVKTEIPKVETEHKASPMSKLKMVFAAAIVIGISWAVVSVVFYAYEGYAPKPVKDVAEILHLDRSSQISGSNISR